MKESTRIKRRLREVSAAYPRVRSLLLETLTSPDAERARRIGELYTEERSQSFAELLIDLEEDPMTRAFLDGMLRGGTPETTEAVSSPKGTFVRLRGFHRLA